MIYLLLTIVFIEVKYRKGGIRAAMEAVNYHKQAQIKKLSQLYLKSQKLKEEKICVEKS